MKKENFNTKATVTILNHTEHKEALLKARDLYLTTESIEQLNSELQERRDEYNHSDPKIHFAPYREGIKIDIQDVTYRISGQFVSVENTISW